MLAKPPIADTPKPTLIQKVTKWALYALLAGILAAAGVLLYWSLENPDVLKINNDKDKSGKVVGFPVRPDVVAPNEVEIITVSYCKLKSAHGVVTARMVGSKSIIEIPWPDDTQPPQCLTTDVVITIPVYARDDEYYVQFDIEYHINPIKTSEVTLKSQPFKVRNTH